MEAAVSWPRGIYLFGPLLLLVAYGLGKGYTRWRQPRLTVGNLQADKRPGFPVFYLTVTNASARAVTPYVEVLPVYDIEGERLSDRFEAHWRGAKEESPRPLLVKNLENEAGVLLVDLERPDAPRLARFPISEPVATRFSDDFVPLLQQQVICLRLVIYCKDEEGHQSNPVSQSYHLVPDKDAPLCYKALRTDRNLTPR